MILKKAIKKIFRILLFYPSGKHRSKDVFSGAITINRSMIKLGERVSFGKNVMLNANAVIEIGDDTMIAYNTIITTSSHDYNEHPMWLKRIDSPIKIGKHVWIGVNSIILPGVVIEDFAVVAAGSVVADNVPQGAIVAGNPARIIKYRNSEIYFRNNINEIKYPGEKIDGTYREIYCKKK